MRKQTGILIVAALVLSAIYVLKFTDWFGPKSIHILFTNRNARVFFGLDGKEYSLTTIKVYRSVEIATNKYAHALWHLVSTNEAGAPAITDFTYGADIPGMKPAVPGTGAEPLKKSVNYRLIVESGKIKGEREFQIH